VQLAPNLTGLFSVHPTTERMSNATVNETEESTSLRADPWRTVWNSLTNNTSLAVVLLAIALTLAVAAWLPQSPDAASDPVAFSRWRGETQTRLGSSFTLLQQAGLFSVERGPVLRVLLSVLALCLSLRLLDSLKAAWRARRSPQQPPHTSFERTTEQSLDGIAAALRKRRFRVIQEGNMLLADRFPAADAGQIAIHLGALLIVISLAISSAAGWRMTNMTLGPEQMAALGHGTPYSLRLDALTPNLTGRITLLKEAEATVESELAVGQPMRWGDLAVFITGIGPAIRASATFTDGQLLRLQASAASPPAAELLLLLTRDDPDRYIGAPDAGLVLRLSRGTGDSQAIHVQVYRRNTGSIVFEGDLPSKTVISAENANFTLAPEVFAILTITRDPGLPITLAGALILALGLLMSAFWRVGRLTAVAEAGETRLIGETDVIRTIEPNAAPGRQRLEVAASVGWKVGLALLSGLIGFTVARSLTLGGALGFASPLISALAAAWLASCAAALLPQRALRWAALALAIAASMVVLSRPGLLIGTGL
jgi:hypothetical protein